MVRPKRSEYLFKVLVIGDASTGKTSFIRRYVHSFFSSAYQATIGVDYAQKTIEYDKDTSVRLQLWDIAGQERFAAMTRAYYREAVGAFLVFDSNQPKTFDSVLRWKQNLDSRVALPDGSRVPCVLLANKCDLIIRTDEDERRLKAFVKQHDFVGYFYTSPKTDLNIEQAARALVDEMVRRHQHMNLSDNSDEIVRVTDGAANQGDQGLACCVRSRIPL